MINEKDAIGIIGTAAGVSGEMTGGRNRVLRRSLNILGFGTAALALSLTAAPAQADTGDRNIAITDTEARLATNQCAESDGWFVPVGGAPGAPSTLIANVAAGGGNCLARVRMVYVRTWNGPAYTTSYTYAVANSANTQVVDSGFRCYVEVGVRRNNGTYFTRFILPSTRPGGCPS